ncbi:DedA family protein [Wenxinia marina]|uniref:Putative membrane-associated protein n=1 Tax=Wenxinia marina DSM 24838 TaxID=1123501 RepID=A0A0D0NQQ8_9RHOB|nr:DedA family protein [Wenxinia marina]KIQ70595.1 putative membrane-associated protein [Wenxinia marina DSM 24838]GGL51859.1 hypothetical protein GCM10011392_02760 [Wenxinia marina]
MTADDILALIRDWGVPALALGTFLSCLAFPVPATLLLLAAGGLAAGGELSLAGATLAAWLGAVAGDQAGYFLARALAGTKVAARLAGKAPAGSMDKARDAIERRGGTAVFLSRWFLSPLSPYVTFAAGAARMNWPRYTLAGAAGEAIWVGMYIALGWVFTDRIAEVSGTAGKVAWAITGLVVVVLIGWAISRRAARE